MKHFERRIIEFRHTGAQAANTPWEPTPIEVEADEMGEIVFAEVDSPGAAGAPVIDGEMSPGEWDKAKSFALVTGGPTAYIMNDDKFLYVAIDDVSPDGFMAFNVYKAGAYTPNKMHSPVLNYDGKKHWDMGTDTDADDIFDSFGRNADCGWFEGAIGQRTEFKVPLANLGVEAGDTVKVGFVMVSGGTTYAYPSGFDAADPATYEDFTLAGAAGEILERWYPVLDGSKFDNYLALNGTRLPLMNPPEIALSRGNLVAFGTPVVEAVNKAVPMLEARCPKFKSKVGVEAWAGTGGIAAPYRIRLHCYIYRKEELPNIGAIVPGLASITDKARRRTIPVGKAAIALTYDDWDKLPGGLMQSVPKINPFFTWAENEVDSTPNVDYSFRAVLGTIDTAKPWQQLYFDYEDGSKILIINGLGVRAPANLKDTALFIAGDYHPKTRIPTEEANNAIHFGHIYPFKPADVPEYVPIPKFDRPYIIYGEIGQVVIRDNGTKVDADTVRVALSGVKIERA